MQIRTRLTLQFLTFGVLILLAAFVSVYLFSEDYREEDFFNRMHNKALNTVRMLVEMEEVDADLLRRIDQDNPITLHEEKVIVLSQKDSVIYTSGVTDVLRRDADLISQIRYHHEIRTYQGKSQLLGMTYTSGQHSIVVILSAVDYYGYKKMTNLLKVLAFVFSLSSIILLAAGWFYSGRALRPISDVIDQVNKISFASLDLRVDGGNGKDEIARLAHTFNMMLDRLEISFRMQKSFITNASHELRTPLTAISGQMEVLLMKKRSQEEYEKAVASILDDMKKLNLLANRLLLLAQASSEGRGTSIKHIRIDEILWQAREDLLGMYPHYRIIIMIDPNIDEESNLTIKGEAQLTKSALINLMDNGCKFSFNHEVHIEVFKSQQSVKVRFIDLGIGIPKEDLETIFEPFRRGSNALNIKGHGIGLSLVERVVKTQGGTISIESQLHEGTIVTIHFPLA